MRKLTHPTYKGTDRPILIGDHVMQPLGRNHEHGTYPYTVTEISERYVTLVSEVNGRSESTYHIFVQPADEASLARVTERLAETHVDQWRKEMRRQGVVVLCVNERHDGTRHTPHLVTLPKGVALAQLRVRDVVEPFVGPDSAGTYDRDDIYLREVDDVKEPYELDALVDSDVTHIDATPMTTLEIAFEAMDRLDEQSYGDTAADVRLIEAALSEMAERLDIELPERQWSEDDGWYDDWDD